MIKYRSRRSNSVIRTETRKLKIVVSSSDQQNSWQTVAVPSCGCGSHCSAAEMVACCVNDGGTVSTEAELISYARGHLPWYTNTLGGDDWIVGSNYYERRTSTTCNGGKTRVDYTTHASICRGNASTSVSSAFRVRCNKPICN